MPAFGEYSEVALCNMALAEIGRGAEIVSLDEKSEPARACRRRYPYARDSVLRGYDWNFAARRASLPAAADPPAFGYARAFPLPADCLLVRAIHNPGTEMWEVEQRYILASAPPPLLVSYTARVTNPSAFDVLFTDALVTRLAADLAVQLSDSQSRANSLYQLFQAKLADARRRDSGEGRARHQVRSTWLDARFDPGFVASGGEA